MSDPSVILAYESCRLEGLNKHQEDAIFNSIRNSDLDHQYFDVYSGRISVRSYVGMVSFDDGTMMEILPNPQKMGVIECKPEVMRSIVQRLLRVYFGNYRKADKSSLDLQKASILDIFIELFCDSVEELMSKGIRSGYSIKQGNQRFIRGRILFTEDIKKNGVIRTGTYVEYSEYCHDRPENRLIKTCLNHLSRTTHSIPLRNRIMSIAERFDDVSVSRDVTKDLRSCIRDRNLTHYRTVISMCEVFLGGQTYTSFRGSSISQALLFNMNDLFEKYIAHIVSSESVRFGAVSCLNSDLFGNRQTLYGDFKLKPDIIVSKDDKVLIMDTKWKDVSSKVSIDDAYQMFAYCIKYGATSAYLIVSSGICREQYIDECGLELHLLNYDLLKDDRSSLINLILKEFEPI